MSISKKGLVQCRMDGLKTICLFSGIKNQSSLSQVISKFVTIRGVVHRIKRSGPKTEP